MRLRNPMLLCVCTMALAGIGPAPTYAQTEELDDTATVTGDEPLDLSTPLAEPGTARAKTPKGFTLNPPAGLNAKVGVDYAKPAIPMLEFKPEELVAGVVHDQSTGVAWANLTAAELPLGWGKATVDTRLDPAQEQGKLGTTLSRSVPIGDGLAVTLQNGLSVSRTLANPANPAQTSSQSWSSSQALRFNILPTDTTLSLGADLSSTDDKWVRSLGAEQKLFGGPFSVSGSVSETATGDLSKSLKAGFKRTW